MSQITKKWIADNAVDSNKLDKSDIYDFNTSNGNLLVKTPDELSDDKQVVNKEYLQANKNVRSLLQFVSNDIITLTSGAWRIVPLTSNYSVDIPMNFNIMNNQFVCNQQGTYGFSMTLAASAIPSLKIMRNNTIQIGRMDSNHKYGNNHIYHTNITNLNVNDTIHMEVFFSNTNIVILNSAQSIARQ